MDDQAVRSLFTKRGKKMGIHQNSPLIDVAEVRKLHALTGDALVTKQANDEALAKIIKGEIVIRFLMKSKHMNMMKNI